jgi:colanic acid/amylovoran biosynthesis protein
MKVLVLWADNHSANYGVRVLAQGSAELVRKIWGPDTAIEFQDYKAGDSLVSFGTKSILRDVGRREGPIKSKLRGYDMIFDTGAGDSFADIYGLKRLSFMLNAARTARKLGIPVVMGPQTVGPFNTQTGRAIGRSCLKHAAVVATRDPISADYSESLGRQVDVLSTDVVFALPRFSVEKSRDIILNVSGLLWFSDQHGSSTRYRDSIIRFLKLANDAGRRVSLFAHVVNEVNVVDDVAAIVELTENHDLADHEILIPDSLECARRFVGSGSWVVGARMHACLNSLSMGTPAIPWAYSRKFSPLMDDIGWGLSVDLATDQDPAAKTMNIILSTDGALASSNVDRVLSIADSRLEQTIASMRSLRVGA